MPGIPLVSSLEGARLAIVKSAPPAPGRLRIRIAQPVPHWMTPEAAVEMARTRASLNPSYRFQVLAADSASATPRVLWDSHPPS